MISETTPAIHDIAVTERMASAYSARPASRSIPGRGDSANTFVREAQSGTAEDAVLYGLDARMISKLEQRDREVRRIEEGKGEALGSSNYIYQTGPDGKRYAIGTAVHVVRADGESVAGENTADALTRGLNGNEMSRSDKALLEKLKARDAKVRSHEAMHMMAAGGQAQGLPTYTYQTAPDGRRYAIGGSVNISVIQTGDEEANVRRANMAYRAAMATGEPSARDMQTAQKAMAISAREKQRALDAYAWQDQILSNRDIAE